MNSLVIAIIAILASMLLPALQQAREKAKLIKCAGNMKTLSTYWLMYMNDSDDNMLSYDDAQELRNPNYASVNNTNMNLWPYMMRDHMNMPDLPIGYWASFPVQYRKNSFLQCPSNMQASARSNARFGYLMEVNYAMPQYFIGGKGWSGKTYQKITKIKQASQKCGWGEVTGLNSSYGGSQYLINNSFASDGSYRAFEDVRHGGYGNMIFCDGHVAKINKTQAKQAYPNWLFLKYGPLWSCL